MYARIIKHRESNEQIDHDLTKGFERKFIERFV